MVAEEELKYFRDSKNWSNSFFKRDLTKYTTKIISINLTRIEGCTPNINETSNFSFLNSPNAISYLLTQ